LYVKNLYTENSEFYTLIFSDKWWKAQFDQIESPTIEKSNELDQEFTEMLDNFLKTYDEKNGNAQEQTLKFRNILKADFESCGLYSDQTKGIPIPPIDKPITENQKIIDLPAPNKDVIIKKDLFDCIADRESRRKFSDKAINLDELSYLLWATQGIRKSFHNNKVTVRTVPSGGARQPFETYLFINKVDGLDVGIYRYQAIDHKLVYLFTESGLEQKVTDASHGQPFAGECAVCFIWSTIPYRCEWRYMTESKKIIAQDSGHLCQNLYLAAESIECGTCAIGAYSQSKMDKLIKVDGVDEFVVYVSPVGKV